MHTKDNRSKRFLLIFASVFVVVCILCRGIFKGTFYVAPGASVLVVPIGLFMHTISLALPSAFLAGIIHIMLPKKPGGR